MSQHGLMHCGGLGSWWSEEESHTCSSFNVESGKWEFDRTLLSKRIFHTSWESPDGTLLVGGRNSTTELLTNSGSEEKFKLKYYSGEKACLINEGDSFVLTGGMESSFTYSGRAARYDKDGWVEDLDNLNVERAMHACGQFLVNSER